uniref:Uncharacterized protein n=1 Tax=Opuntia streptacantha TaxID=393608 RepID=A0A7C8YZ97_OPUST
MSSVDRTALTPDKGSQPTFFTPHVEVERAPKTPTSTLTIFGARCALYITPHFPTTCPNHLHNHSKSQNILGHHIYSKTFRHVLHTNPSPSPLSCPPSLSLPRPLLWPPRWHCHILGPEWQ